MTWFSISLGSSEFDKVEEWNGAQVCEFLEKRGFNYEPFAQNEIDGARLEKLSHRELLELGIPEKELSTFDELLTLEITYRKSMDEIYRSKKH